MLLDYLALNILRSRGDEPLRESAYIVLLEGSNIYGIGSWSEVVDV